MSQDDRPRVDCDEGCGAYENPKTLKEWKDAAIHWKKHGLYHGCSHGC